MGSAASTQPSSALPWHPWHLDCVRWVMARTWNPDETLERNIQASIYAHAELVALVRLDARRLAERMGVSGHVWESMLYRYALRRYLSEMRYDARFVAIKARLRNSAVIAGTGT